MEKKDEIIVTAHEAVTEDDTLKPKRGRPRVSPHDRATQKRLSVQRYRQAKREGEEVPVEIYLPKDWHDWLTGERGANLREVAVEAFALWLKREGYPVESADDSSRSEPS